MLYGLVDILKKDIPQKKKMFKTIREDKPPSRINPRKDNELNMTKLNSETPSHVVIIKGQYLFFKTLVTKRMRPTGVVIEAVCWIPLKSRSKIDLPEIGSTINMIEIGETSDDGTLFQIEDVITCNDESTACRLMAVAKGAG